MLSERGDVQEATKNYINAIVIIQQLTNDNPDNAEWQHTLHVLQNDIGNIAFLQGNLNNALIYYRDALTIAHRMTENLPNNNSWKRNLAVSMQNIGKTLCDKGDLNGAAQSFLDSLAVQKQLANVNPNNIEWQRDLFMGYANMAIATEQNKLRDAKIWWHKAYEQLSGMKQRGIMLPTDEQYLGWLKEKAGE